MVSCPICAKNVPLEHINSHLDTCDGETTDVVKSESSDNDPKDVKGLNIGTKRSSDTEVIEIDDDYDVEGSKENSVSLKLNKKIKMESSPKMMKTALDLQHQTKAISDIIGAQRKKSKRESITPTKTNGESFHKSINTASVSSSSSSASSNTSNVPPPSSNSSTTYISKSNASDYSQLEEIKQLKADLHRPLAERLRPRSLRDYVGQQHLVGADGVLRNLIESNSLPSLIFWGPPGVGKTTLARIISNENKGNKFIELNATNSGATQLRTIFETAIKDFKLLGKKTIVFIDEIHRFNKSQQDLFLPYVESGTIKIIGATSENPSFKLNNALLSRCKVFHLEKHTDKDITTVINKGILYLNKIRKLINNQPLLNIDKTTIDHISSISNGDSRIALNILELIDSFFKNSTSSPTNKIQISDIKPILAKLPMLYDRSGEFHYDSISALHKSIRGSNVNASLWYLAIMLESGEDPLYIARRLIRIASEDIGTADESCLPFAISTYQAVQFIGLPDVDLALVQCVAKFASAKKSVKIYRAWKEIKSVLGQENGLKDKMMVPLHLRNAPTKLMDEMGYAKGYKYNPDFKDGIVKQDYFVNKELEKMKFYENSGDLGSQRDPDL